MARAKPRQNYGLRVSLAVAAGLFAGCGKKEKRSSSPADAAIAYQIPDILGKPPAVSPVPIGSLGVKAVPEATGAFGAPIAVKLLTEPGATLQVRLTAPRDETGWNAYGDPLLVTPPVTVWARATKGGATGEVKSFTFAAAPELLPEPLLAQIGLNGSALPEKLLTPGFTSAVTSAALAGGDGRTLDAAHDVPEAAAATDLVSVQAEGDGQGGFVATMRFAAQPVLGEARLYGFEIGPSGISLQSFGSGATFAHHFESTNAEHAAMFAVEGDAVVVRVPAAAVADLADVKELVARGYAATNVGGVSAQDRSEPLFLRSAFTLLRSPAPSPMRAFELDMRVAPAVAKATYVQEYAALAARFMPDLERATGIPIIATRTVPLAVVPESGSDFTGLNTSDRGLVLTLAGDATLVARSQLFLHELAHYQNARFSRLKPRWLQEGMSEWVAERLLYRYFPARAAHRYMAGLRFEPFLAAYLKAPDAFPLETWTGSADRLGYEKSLIFLDALASRLGDEPLRKAFALGVNEALDTAAFMRWLTQETGQDVASLLPYWVDAGEPAAGMAPDELLADDDGDELLNFEERALGTDPARVDSDGDGYPDGEEVFARQLAVAGAAVPPGAPAQTQRAAVPSDAPALVGNEESAPFLRLAGDPTQKITFSFVPGDAAPALPYSLPRGARAPFDVTAAFAGKDAVTLQSPLYVDGQEVATPLAATHHLPPTPVTTIATATGIGDVTLTPDDLHLDDFAFDIPARFGAYDLTGVDVEQSADALTMVIATRAPPTMHGEDGDYVVTFETGVWNAQGSKVTRRNALKISSGTPYFYVYDDETGAQGKVEPGVSVAYGTAMTVRIDRALLSDWLAFTGGERLICVQTTASLEGGVSYDDDIGCAAYDGAADTGFVATRRQIAGAFGTGSHALELRLANVSHTPARAAHLTDLGLTAIQAFERVLGQPLLERSHWVAHVTLAPAIATSGSASLKGGAQLRLASNLEGPTLDYLFVEQLARLALSDVLARHEGTAPYWLQELYVQWLTMSALGDDYPTTAVHDFHEGRLADYFCYKTGGCPSLFASDGPLSGWSSQTAGSTGSVKTLMLTLQLDALVGAEAMARALRVYPNALPDSALLEARLKAFAPSKAAALDALWLHYVDGSGNAAADYQALADAYMDHDGDGLYEFEEARLGTSPTTPTPYL